MIVFKNYTFVLLLIITVTIVHEKLTSEAEAWSNLDLDLPHAMSHDGIAVVAPATLPGLSLSCVDQSITFFHLFEKRNLRVFSFGQSA